MPLDISVANRSFVRAWVLALAAGACLAGAPAFAADYVQAPGSSLIFASRYQGEVFTGQFAKFSTRLSFDPQQLADARLDVVIALASASSANDDRDAALQSADFFDTAKFPQAHYRASKFRHLGGNRYAADGSLSLRGVSQPVTLTFTWTPGAQPLLSGKATVQRLDFGVGAGDWADLELIPNGVAISTKVLLTPAK
jgi:polyisoprenoid-binding protein YceI